MLTRQRIILLAVCCWGFLARTQEFLNGSFENNTAVTAANNVLNNLNNTAFNALVPDCHSFGATLQGISGHLDLMTHVVSQWGSTDPAFDGDWYVGIGMDPNDRLSLKLSAPLVPGMSYILSFYDKGGTNAMPFEIGLSTTEDAVGTPVYTTLAGAVTDVWTQRIFTFVAPNNGQFITIRQQDAVPVSWAMIDDFHLEPAPCAATLDLGPDAVVCEGATFIADAGAIPGAAYSWNDLSTAQTLAITEAGTYWGTVTSPGCVLSDTIRITTEAPPVVAFSVDRMNGCEPLAVVLTNDQPAIPGQTFGWNLGDGTTVSGAGPIAHTFAAGCFDLALTVTSANACAATLSVANLVCVDPKPVAAFATQPATVFSDDPQVQFVNASDLDASNAWTFGDGGTSVQFNPLHVFPIGIKADYSVELIVTSAAGCKDTAHALIEVVYPYLLYMPNAFTPDGDELNNVLKPAIGGGYDANDYTFTIVNRWGEVLFESHDSEEGWDGAYAGTIAKSDVYTWQLTIGDLYSDDKTTLTGNVMLLR